MKPTDEQIRAEAERYSDAKGELALARGKMENAFIAGYNRALSQNSTIKKVKELRNRLDLWSTQTDTAEEASILINVMKQLNAIIEAK